MGKRNLSKEAESAEKDVEEKSKSGIAVIETDSSDEGIQLSDDDEGACPAASPLLIFLNNYYSYYFIF